MTAKQQAFLKELPRNGFNISKTAREVGYTDSSSKNGTQINRLREIASKKYFDEDYIRKQYKKTIKQAEKSSDLTNKLRTLEGMARIEAMFTDKQVNVNPDRLVIIDKSTNSKALVDNTNNG